MEGDTGEILTPKEIARKMKVSRKTVIRWIVSGELAGFRYGRLYRVARSAFKKFLCSHMICKEKD